MLLLESVRRDEEMEERDVEKGLLGSGEEPHQQIIPREETTPHGSEVRKCHILL